MYDSPIEGTGDEGVLMLNDDCLVHIFRFMSLTDLGSIKATCKRFSQVADLSFKLRKDKSLTIDDENLFTAIWNFKHFGKYINELNVKYLLDQYATYKDIFEIIAKFSTDQLKSISLDLNCDKSLIDDDFKCLEKTMKNVEKIHLKDVETSYMQLLLSQCENLNEVNLDFEGDPIILDTQWFLKNVTITSMTIKKNSNDDILDLISTNLINLEFLHYHYAEKTGDKLSYLGRLIHLKKLRILLQGGADIGPALRNFANKNILEHLCLEVSGPSETLAHTLIDFPILKELIFSFSEIDGNMRHILSKNLVNVRKLVFYECENITFDDVTIITEDLIGLNELSVHECEMIDFINRHNYLRLSKKRNLEIFLDTHVYNRTIQLVANYLSNYVRVTARLSEFQF